MAWTNIFVMTIYPRLHPNIGLQLTITLQMFHNIVNISVMGLFIYDRPLDYLHIIIFVCCFFSLLFFIWSLVNTVLQLQKMKRDGESVVTDEFYVEPEPEPMVKGIRMTYSRRSKLWLNK